MQSLISSLKKFSFAPERIINSIKAALACLIAVIVSKVAHFDMPAWLVISSYFAIATSVHIGGALKKSYLRLIGTVIGSCAAVFTLLLFGQHQIIIYIVFAFLILIFSYIATSPSETSYLGFLGGATVIIILIINNPSLSFALERFLETIIGLIIGIAVTLLVFPIHSKQALHKSIGATLNNLAELYQILMNNELFTHPNKQETSEENILRGFSRQGILVQETIAESRKFKNRASIYQNIVQCERALFRISYMLRQILLLSDYAQTIKVPELIELNQKISQIFSYLGNLTTATNTQTDKNFIDLHNQIERLIATINQNNPFHSDINLHTFIFCMSYFQSASLDLEQLLQKLNQLENA